MRNGDLEERSTEEDEGLMVLNGKDSQIGKIRRAVCEMRSGDSW